MTVQVDPLESADQPDQSDKVRGKPSGLGRWTKVLLGVLALVLLVGLGFRILVGSLNPHLYAGTVFQFDEPAAPLEGIYLADGSEVDLTAYEGELLLVFFGYTFCPDVCPTTLSGAAQAIEGLDADTQERVNLLMVSVDPTRDDPETTNRYAQFFSPQFLGASGDVAAIDRAASLYGIYYDIREPEAADQPDNYLVDHTATLMGITPDGVLRIVWPPDISPDLLRADIAELLS
jgi:protein SCO1/2